jgi:hypothetical protein
MALAFWKLSVKLFQIPCKIYSFFYCFRSFFLFACMKLFMYFFSSNSIQWPFSTFFLHYLLLSISLNKSFTIKKTFFFQFFWLFYLFKTINFTSFVRAAVCNDIRENILLKTECTTTSYNIFLIFWKKKFNFKIIVIILLKCVMR